MTIKKLYKKKDKITVPRSLHRLFPNVKKAYDASDSIEVKVITRDCEISTKKDPTECAMAKALKRELKASKVIIGMTSSYVINGDTAVRFQTPGSVQKELVSFDRHKDFEPGDYYLKPHSKTNKLGYPKEPGKSGKSVKRAYHKTARVRAI